MNAQNFDQMEARAVDGYDELSPNNRKLKARAAIEAEAEKMIATGKAYRLTDEEVQLLRYFRRFKSKCRKAGQVFRWQTAPDANRNVSDDETGCDLGVVQITPEKERVA